MKQELMDAIQETPVIAAVKDDAGLCNALTNENIRVVFVLYGDICNIASIVRRIHEAGRFAAVHVDLIAGLAGKEVAVDFIRNTTEADGIISTRQSFIRRAKELGLAAILRVFLLDSIALESLDKIPPNLPDCLDLLPGYHKSKQVLFVSGDMSETDKGSCLCFGSLFFCTINSCPAPDGPRQNGQEEKNNV